MQRFDPTPIPISYDNRMPEGRKAFVGQPNLLVFQGLCTCWISCVSPFVVLSLYPLHSQMAGQAAWQPDPDAFPVEVCPRSGSHHVMGSAVKALVP
jgi:hypothetical protein